MHRRFRPRSLGTFVAFAAALLAPTAFAQSDKAGAETLLNEAMKLEGSHDYARACPALEESLRLYASLNTEYFLADCYEHAGKMATAWVDYLEVAEKAHAAGESAKERKARERAAQIEGKVSHLTIRVGDAAANVKIARDGVEVGRAQWGLPMPVDSGVHIVVASAPGHVPATVRASLEHDGDDASVTVPALEAEAGPNPAAAPPTSPVPPAAVSAPTPVATATPEAPSPAGGASGRGQRIAGWIVGGAGVAAMGVASALALSAKSSYEGAPGCNATACTDESGFEARNSAHAQGNVATVVFIVGAAAVVGGGVLWLTAPSSASATSAGNGGSAGTLRFGLAPGAAFVGGRF